MKLYYNPKTRNLTIVTEQAVIHTHMNQGENPFKVANSIMANFIANPNCIVHSTRIYLPTLPEKIPPEPPDPASQE